MCYKNCQIFLSLFRREKEYFPLAVVIQMMSFFSQVDDLEQWIADREVTARSQDCGQDLEQCEV